MIRDNDGVFSPQKRDDIALELGDVLWYIATMANDLGFSLDEIASRNIAKLTSRASRNRLSGSGDNR